MVGLSWVWLRTVISSDIVFHPASTNVQIPRLSVSLGLSFHYLLILHEFINSAFLCPSYAAFLMASLQNELAGLGGDIGFLKNEVDLQVNVPLPKDMVRPCWVVCRSARRRSLCMGKDNWVIKENKSMRYGVKGNRQTETKREREQICE